MFNNFQYVDISYLQNLTGGDVTVIREIVNLFKLEVPKYLSDLSRCNNEKNWDDLAAVAHKAKSSFALMGIGDVVTDLKNLELLAREKKDNEQFTVLITSVQSFYEKAITELNQFLEEISSN